MQKTVCEVYEQHRNMKKGQKKDKELSNSKSGNMQYTWSPGGGAGGGQGSFTGEQWLELKPKVGKMSLIVAFAGFT